MIASECRNCEVYGFCTTTEQECEAYQVGLGLWTEKMKEDCLACEHVSYCTGLGDCVGGGVDHGAEGVKPYAGVDNSGKNAGHRPTNKGLINWITGLVTDIDPGEEAYLVTISVGDQCLTAMVPARTYEELGCQKGEKVTFAVKALNVKLLR